MASQTASHKALGSPSHNLSPEPAQGPTTFHGFGDLPAELQLDIWDLAFPDLKVSPSILCFKIQVLRTPKGNFACFSPDGYTVSVTHEHRTLLKTCYTTREIVLKRLNILTLLRYKESTGKISEIRIPFDSKKTCFCIHGWEENFMEARKPKSRSLKLTHLDLGGVAGLDFTKEVQRLAFVVQEEYTRYMQRALLGRLRKELQYLAFVFHNAEHVGGITSGALELRWFLTQKVFSSLFSLQPFHPKTEGDGGSKKRLRSQHKDLFTDAMVGSFKGMGRRMQDAVRSDSWLYGTLARILWAHVDQSPESEIPERNELEDLGMSQNTIDFLILEIAAQVGYIDPLVFR